MKTEEEVTTVRNPALWMNEMGNKGCRYWRGCVFTEYGIVAVYRQRKMDYTQLHFTHSGKWYSRSFEAFYSDRYLITLAKRFAEEITCKG